MGDQEAPKTRGRKQKYAEEGRKQVSLTYSQELETEIQEASQLIRVTGYRKKPRPMLRAEYLREGARVLADLVRRGKYKPRPNRLDESPIAEVLRHGEQVQRLDALEAPAEILGQQDVAEVISSPT